MRVAALSVRLLTTAAFGITIASAGAIAVRAADDAAGHAIAEKFATEAAKQTKEAADKRAAEARRKAEAQKRKEAEKRRADEAKSQEADMLAAARLEAEQRRIEQDRQRLATEAAEAEKLIAEAKAEQQRLREMRAAEAARKSADAKAAADLRQAEAKAAEERRAAEAKAADEARRLAEAKAAEDRRAAEIKAADEARRLAEAKAAEDRRAAEMKAADEARRLAEAKAAEERRVAELKAADEARRVAEEAARNAEEAREAAQRQRMAAERDEETRRVAERLRQAREARAAAPPLVSDSDLSRPGAIRVEPPLEAARVEPDAARSSHVAHAPGLVTVLLLMEPGNRGIRRHNKSADPVLCSTDGCYISNGPEQGASLMSGHKALGFGRIFGARAGACSNSLGCVFRGVSLASLPGVLQPVDMRVIHHDRRESQAIDGPADCRMMAGRLVCRHTIHASNYTMWVIPEAVAEAAGPYALERALAEGLPEAEHAALPFGPRH